MAIADAPARKGANLAIEQVGQSLTYVRVGDGSTSLTTLVHAPSKTEYTLKGYVTGIDHRLVDNDKIFWTDRMVLIDAVRFEAAIGSGAIPGEDDEIKVGSETLSVVRLIPISSGEQFALFKIVVRK